MHLGKLIETPAKSSEARDVTEPTQSVKQEQPAPNVVLTALDAFLASYLAEAASESADRVGGLNGYLSSSRLSELFPAMRPGLAVTLASMGALYHRAHFLEDILERYADALELPEADLAPLRLIRSIAPDPLSRAAELYAAALAADPGYGLAAFNLADIRAHTDRGLADALYRRAAASDATLAPHAALRRAALSEEAGDWAEAAALYVEAIAGLQHIGRWHLNLARCLRRCGRCDEALLHYERALDWRRFPAREFMVPSAPNVAAGSVGYAADPIAAAARLGT